MRFAPLFIALSAVTLSFSVTAYAQQTPVDGLAPELTDINAKEMSYEAENKRPYLDKPIISAAPKDQGDGIPVGIIQQAYAGTPIEGWLSRSNHNSRLTFKEIQK